MKILLAGASGLIGSSLINELLKSKYQVLQLVRGSKGTLENVSYLNWDPERKEVDISALQDCDAVINLAGETIFGQWTTEKKKRILESRVKTTTFLVDVVKSLKTPPRVFINASATGFKKARGDEKIFETGNDPAVFLEQVCQKWEMALKPIVESPIRCVVLRFGAVLSKDGGALKTMLPAFKFGLGGKLGSGTQGMSWIAIDDVVSSILFLLQNENCRGAFNIVSPFPVTNAELTELLSECLHRPAFFSMPAPFVRFIFGKLADELLLADAPFTPNKLLEAGFCFSYPDLKKALNHLL